MHVTATLRNEHPTPARKFVFFMHFPILPIFSVYIDIYGVGCMGGAITQEERMPGLCKKENKGKKVRRVKGVKPKEVMFPLKIMILAKKVNPAT